LCVRQRCTADPAKLGYTDLGMWNIYGNPDFPDPQKGIEKLFCSPGKRCDKTQVLQQTLARFRTLGLRDLGHSAPYLHTGSMDTLEDVLRFYISVADLGRRNRLRNADPDILDITFSQGDISALAAFLRALNADYN
jgi:cytochrome c peroxidase